VVTLLAVIIGVLSLLSAVVCSKCSESYDGRAKHVCGTTGTTNDDEDWFDGFQSSLGGLIALDWAKDGTIIQKVRRVWRMTIAEAIQGNRDIPDWLKADQETKAGVIPWAERFILIIERAEGTDVLVHQPSLIRSIAEVLQVMREAKHIYVEESGAVYFKTGCQFVFDLRKSGGRQFYEATFVL